MLVFYDQPHGMVGAQAEGWAAVREGVMLGAARSPVPTLVSSTLPELLDDGAAWEMIEAGRAGRRRIADRPALRGGDARRRTPQPDGGAAAIDRGDGAPGRAGGVGEGSGGRLRGRPWLAEHEAKALLRDAGVPVADGVVVDSLEAAVAARAALGGTIALKLSAASVQHKSDIGGIALGLAADDDVARRVRARWRRWRSSTAASCWPSGWPRPAVSS